MRRKHIEKTYQKQLRSPSWKPHTSNPKSIKCGKKEVEKKQSVTLGGKANVRNVDSTPATKCMPTEKSDSIKMWKRRNTDR
jgi:hypothetical protein